MTEINKSKNDALIAIVDDDASVCEALESLLKSIGFQAASFTSARSFLDSPQFPNVSCLVLDVSMPNMDGLELQRHLASTNPIPIIFITAHRDEKTRERALRAGAIKLLEQAFQRRGPDRLPAHCT